MASVAFIPAQSHSYQADISTEKTFRYLLRVGPFFCMWPLQQEKEKWHSNFCWNLGVTLFLDSWVFSVNLSVEKKNSKFRLNFNDEILSSMNSFL